ncbi:hypothetical protein BATDEDRAFT_89502 [Batrachochytrium dendrobatidis JAM81]|uniref:26S proteasome non-ATPase regulatory subunit 5 n=1 Tax=Batrachochytrium dendrobatidis (strain JAM81 / FGSC 10211) TaxID=684364 RepID=F4P5H5_BATDJ|nr:uncharacterized protein BATDEDRAFT_89502 [Batrachochytrium dendrobatidis JAM81]EGF79418.1 hypothetical protein BATDEDRAFT_89502 [Batrachochytrium dendrobatidis JAM81]|eukprot:XP_006680147.1 hypothetical protein BATDEDRAFT_89502 [Batrachochytrium dendrobatidis JAM81]
MTINESTTSQQALLASTQVLEHLALSHEWNSDDESALLNALTIWKVALESFSQENGQVLAPETVVAILCKSSSTSIIELCCAVLNKILSKLSFADILSFKDLLRIGFQSKLSVVNNLVFNIIQRAVYSESDLRLLVESNIFTLVIQCIAFENSQVAEMASSFLKQLGRHPFALEALLSPDNISTMDRLSSESITVKLRIYDLLVNISMSSQSAFDYCAQQGALSSLTGVIFQNDLLESINVIEILTSFTETPNGYFFLEKAGVISQLFDALQISPNVDDIVSRLTTCATIKFWGMLIFNQHQYAEAIQTRFDILGALQPFLEESDSDIKDAIFVAVANFGSREEGLTILYQQSIFLDTIIAMCRSSTGDAKLSLLRTYSCLLGVGSIDNDQTERMTLHIFEKLETHGLSIKQLMQLTKGTIEELSVAAYAVLNGVLSHTWGIEKLAHSSEFSEYVVSRHLGAIKSAQEWHMSLVRTILDHPARVTKLGGLIQEKLEAYKRQGVYYTESQPIIAMHSA